MAATVLTGMLLVGGCAVGPDPGPGVVTGGGHGGAEQPTSSTSATPPLPSLTAPRTDLSWKGCAQSTASSYGINAPRGVDIECARLEVPIDPDRPTNDTLTVALTRARTAATPKDAAPVVLTSGTDLPSSRTLLLLAGGDGHGLIDKHPVVAIDRRGIGASSTIDCLTRTERTAMVTNGLSGRASVDQNDRIDALARSASTGADGCGETLSPYQLDYTAALASSDIEALRSRWGVDHLALLGVGEGSDVVLSYASRYAGRAGRIILDTPTAFGATTRDRASARATGVQSAIATFVQQCAAGGSCPLGSDGVGLIGTVLDKARAGGLGGLSDTEVLSAITTSLAVSANDAPALTSLAAAIAAANNDNSGALRALVDQATGLRVSDGQIVGTCNDVNGVTGQNEIPGLIDSWSKQNPLTGADSALSLVRCASWPTTAPINPPSALPVSPLILDGSNDPINGGGGADAMKAVFIKASTSPTTVSWDGLGYSVAARSACAADVVDDYLGNQPLGDPADRGCPAS